MIPRLVVVGGLVLALGLACAPLNRPVAAPPGPEAEPAAPEFKAVAFGTDERAATEKLNALALEGWEYVGPLGNGLVAFRRFAPGKDAAARKEVEKLQGTWSRVSIAHKSTRRGENRGDTSTYSGDKFAIKQDGKVIMAGTYKVVDAAGTPKQLDYFVAEGATKGTHFRAIYKIEGDVLHVCTDGGNNSRPKEFSGKAGFYRVVRRQRPSP